MAININELQDLLNNANATALNGKAIRKGLTRIEKLVNGIMKEVLEVNALMDSTTSANKSSSTHSSELDSEAPYGRKKDGTPKAKAGRNRTSL